MIKKLDEAEQFAAMGVHISRIKNPSEGIQLAAVQQGRDDTISYIKAPSEAVQLAAVKKCGRAIGYIKDPSEEVKLAAVKQDGYALLDIKNPGEALQLIALKQANSNLFGFIKRPSEAVQLAALELNSRAIKNIKNPREKLIIDYIRPDPLNRIVAIKDDIPEAMQRKLNKILKEGLGKENHKTERPKTFVAAQETRRDANRDSTAVRTSR
jgi:hypothetical protein